MHKGGISIWFFNGVLMLVTGVLILGAGIYQLVSPPPLEHRVVLYHLHAPIWWGALLALFGAIYCWRFLPSRIAAAK
jgi:hypothetical protein